MFWHTKMRERIESLESQVKTLFERDCDRKAKIASISKQLEQLQCSHDSVVFHQDSDIPWVLGGVLFKKECKKCGKLLSAYRVKEDMLRAQLKDVKLQLDKEKS